MNKSRELTKNTLIITIGRISTQFVTFLLLPLYTSLLSAKEYGTVDLITTLVQLFIPITSLMIDQGVFRYLLNCRNDSERRTIVSCAFLILSILNSAFLLIYVVGSPFIHNDYKIWVFVILIATAYNNLFLQVARGLNRTNDYALGSFICSSSTIILNVFFIAFIKMGATGMLIATFLGNCIGFVFLFFKLNLKKYISLKDFDKRIAKNELRYSAPLVPNQLSIWVMNSSDRIIVTFFLGAAANGILAVSHKFPAIYMTFFNIFLLAWHETGTMHFYDDDREVFFSEMIEKIIVLFSSLCMGIIVVLPVVFNWFVNSAYNEAYYNIPIYMMASLFNVVVGLLGVIYVATKKTSEIAKTTIMAALINIIVNVVLIKQIGLYAASISTFMGYFLTMIYRIIDAKKYIKITYNHKKNVALVVSLVVCSVIYYLNNKIISLIFFPFFLILVCYFNQDIMMDAYNLLKEKMGMRDYDKK